MGGWPVVIKRVIAANMSHNFFEKILKFGIWNRDLDIFMGWDFPRKSLFWLVSHFHKLENSTLEKKYLKKVEKRHSSKRYILKVSHFRHDFEQLGWNLQRKGLPRSVHGTCQGWSCLCQNCHCRSRQAMGYKNNIIQVEKYCFLNSASDSYKIPDCTK